MYLPLEKYSVHPYSSFHHILSCAMFIITQAHSCTKEMCTGFEASHHSALYSFRLTYVLFTLLPPSCGTVTVRAESWCEGEKGESSAVEMERHSEVTPCQKFTGKLTYLEDGNGLKRGCLTLRS